MFERTLIFACSGLLLALGACDEKAMDDLLASETVFVQSAVTPHDAKELLFSPAEHHYWSHAAEWRFTTAQPAADYRASMLRSLSSRYSCQQQRRRLYCTRPVTAGDRARLDLNATPSNGATLVKVRLVIAVD